MLLLSSLLLALFPSAHADSGDTGESCQPVEAVFERSENFNNVGELAYDGDVATSATSQASQAWLYFTTSTGSAIESLEVTYTTECADFSISVDQYVVDDGYVPLVVTDLPPTDTHVFTSQFQSEPNGYWMLAFLSSDYTCIITVSEVLFWSCPMTEEQPQDTGNIDTGYSETDSGNLDSPPVDSDYGDSFPIEDSGDFGQTDTGDKSVSVDCGCLSIEAGYMMCGFLFPLSLFIRRRRSSR